MTADPATTRVGGAAAGAAVAASVWISEGTLAVVNATSLVRVAALPDATWLAVAIVAGAGVGALVRPRRSILAPLALLALLWLPWLPVRVPAAFLMWEGPLEGLVWGAALAAATWRIIGTRAAAAFAPWSAPPRAPVVAGAVAVVVFAGAWLTARPRVPAGDEPHYLVITQSLLRDGDLAIENNHQQDQYLQYYDGALKPDFMRRGVDRQIYSIHAPGVSALVLPAFALAGYHGAVATVIGVAAAGMAAVWVAAFWLTASIGAAWAAWLALVVAAPVVLHGYTIYPDGVGAAAAMAGVLGLVALDRWPGMVLSRAGWAAIGAALAVLPWLHTRFALVAGVLGLAIVLRLRPRPGSAPAITAFLLPPLMAAAAWFTYFWRIYGTPNPAAPYGARPAGGLGVHPGGRRRPAERSAVRSGGDRAGAAGRRDRPGAPGTPAAATGGRADGGTRAVPVRRVDLPDVVGRVQRAGALRRRRIADARPAGGRVVERRAGRPPGDRRAHRAVGGASP